MCLVDVTTMTFIHTAPDTSKTSECHLHIPMSSNHLHCISSSTTYPRRTLLCHLNHPSPSAMSRAALFKLTPFKILLFQDAITPLHHSPTSHISARAQAGPSPAHNQHQPSHSAAFPLLILRSTSIQEDHVHAML
jgi:hypothetical protein